MSINRANALPVRITTTYTKNKMNLTNCIIVLIVIIATTTTIATAPTIDVVFIIQTPDSQHSTDLSKKLKKDIIKQSKELQMNFKVKVHLLYDIFNYPGGWTIHNLIPQLMSYQRTQRQQYMDAFTQKQIDQDMEKGYGEIINNNTRWIIFCEDKTKVKVQLLMESLNNENHEQPLFLGHALYDREPTIIHHFAFFDNPNWFPYPLLRAGVVLSMPLVKSIAEIYNNHNNNNQLFKQQFSIDAGHELARFIYDNIHVPLATTAATTSPYRSQNVNCLNETSSTSVKNIGKTSKLPKKIETLFNPSLACTGGTTNISILSSSDLRTMTTNEMRRSLHETETFKPRGDKDTTTKTKTSIIKKQKIILKKASFVCPTDTWEKSGSSSKSRSNMGNDNESCAMYAEQTVNPVSTMACAAVRREEIYFAVKTCSKYHNERLPILQATWAPYARHLKYFSDKQDDLIPTVSTGVPNVEMGHCAKTLKILNMALKDIENFNSKLQYSCQAKEVEQEYYQIKWLFLSDDDTLLSISGVCQVLGCYNSMDEIYLGERYGYRLFAQDGFNYITGGGGIAFSLPTVKLILQYCSCPSASAPDDMILGSCLHSLQLKAVHSARFHQARPHDYPLELLQQEPPISFHKFWQLDPLDVYREWFAAGDHKMFGVTKQDFKKLNTNDLHFPTRKLLHKKEALSLNKMPVSVMASMHHSKERHVDL